MNKYLELLGKTVEVIVDRPLGSKHPNYDDIIYPINYGYIKKYIAGDGEYLDAYILGVHKPVKKFKGTVIAIIARNNDVEDKIIVSNKKYIAPQIYHQVEFIEKYFETVLFCRYEKSAGGILYEIIDNELHFLIVKNRHGKYGFPKGHLEQDENAKQAAIREIKEEVGIEVTLNDNFKLLNKYKINKYTIKTVELFLADIHFQAIKIDYNEISEYKLLKLNECIETLSYDFDKKALKKANLFLEREMI